jgi:hypothetical protein
MPLILRAPLVRRTHAAASRASLHHRAMRPAGYPRDRAFYIFAIIRNITHLNTTLTVTLQNCHSEEKKSYKFIKKDIFAYVACQIMVPA